MSETTKFEWITIEDRPAESPEARCTRCTRPGADVEVVNSKWNTRQTYHRVCAKALLFDVKVIGMIRAAAGVVLAVEAPAVLRRPAPDRVARTVRVPPPREGGALMASQKVKIEIRRGNAAMQDGVDLAWALRRLADRVDGGEWPGESVIPVRDINGNTVGTLTTNEDEEQD